MKQDQAVDMIVTLVMIKKVIDFGENTIRRTC